MNTAFRAATYPNARLRAIGWSKQPTSRLRQEWMATALNTIWVRGMEAADQRLLGYAIG
jgi:hypothetical protein